MLNMFLSSSLSLLFLKFITFFQLQYYHFVTFFIIYLMFHSVQREIMIIHSSLQFIIYSLLQYIRNIPMEDQYKKLSKYIEKYYISISLVAFLLIAAVAVFQSNMITITSELYPDERNNVQLTKLKNIIDISQATVQSVSMTIYSVLIGNYAYPNSSLYCNTNLTYQQCLNIYQNQQFWLVDDAYSISTSFRCLKGTCLQISPLQDYLGTFKIRLTFIDYLLIQYKVNNQTNELIVPALANQAISINEIQIFKKGNIGWEQGSFVLSKTFQINNQTVRVTIVFNQQALQNNYDIKLANFIFNGDLSEPIQLQVGTLSPYFSINFLPYNFGIVLDLIFSFIILVLVIRYFISRWQGQTFKHLQTLNSLYQYQLNQIFLGRKPKNTVIMTQNSMSFFFQQLSYIMQKDYEQLSMQTLSKEKEQPFKFTTLIKKIMYKFQSYHNPIHDQRTRQLGNFKYLIKTSVTEIGQSIKKRMDELFLISRDMHLSKAFFLYGYLSLLLNMQEYDKFLKDDNFPLPEAMASLFRYLNRTINSSEIRFAFKFAFHFDSKMIEEQLIMKIHFNLLQRYFMNMKELDFGLSFAKQLKLEKELRYLQEIIENKKYIFITYLK